MLHRCGWARPWAWREEQVPYIYNEVYVYWYGEAGLSWKGRMTYRMSWFSYLRLETGKNANEIWVVSDECEFFKQVRKNMNITPWRTCHWNPGSIYKYQDKHFEIWIGRNQGLRFQEIEWLMVGRSPESLQTLVTLEQCKAWFSWVWAL